MLSIMNEIDPYLLLSLYVLYKIENQIFQQFHEKKGEMMMIGGGRAWSKGELDQKGEMMMIGGGRAW